MMKIANKVAFCEAVSELTGWVCLGYGNNRACFDLGDGTVIKFNFHESHTQSKREIERWLTATAVEREDYLPLLSFNSEGNWVVSPKVLLKGANTGYYNGRIVLVDYGEKDITRWNKILGKTL